MRFKERRSSTLSVKSERRVAIGDEKQRHDRVSYFSSSTMSSTLSHPHFFFYGHRSFHSVEKLSREETLDSLLCEEWEFYYFAQCFIQSLGKFYKLLSCSDLVYYYFLSSSLAKKKKKKNYKI
jgi:hypothetical protein